MKVVYTAQSIESLEEALLFLLDEQKLSPEKVLLIRDNLFKKADKLQKHPYSGQQEEYLEHLDQGHRRIIEGYFKIIYRVENEIIYITDFFDVRQDPAKMKG